jgi:hypothetical protein
MLHRPNSYSPAITWHVGRCSIPSAISALLLAIPYLKQSEAGSIICMSWLGERFGYPNRSLYCTAKMGLIDLAKTLDEEREAAISIQSLKRLIGAWKLVSYVVKDPTDGSESSHPLDD